MRIRQLLGAALPRLALAVVYLLFGVDKFLRPGWYVNYFQVTARVRAVIPTGDYQGFTLGLGVVELLVGALLIAGLFTRLVAAAAAVLLLVFLGTVQWPLSFPQDFGLLGLALFLVARGPDPYSSDARLRRATLGARSLWVLTRGLGNAGHAPAFGLAGVLLLGAVIELVLFDTYVAWLRLGGRLTAQLPTSVLPVFLMAFAATQAVVGVSLLLPRRRWPAAGGLAVLLFLVGGIGPPLDYPQYYGLVLSAAWLLLKSPSV